MDRGTYRIPEAVAKDARSVTVSARELALLFEFEGVDQAMLRAARRSVARDLRVAADELRAPDGVASGGRHAATLVPVLYVEVPCRESHC